MLGSRSNLSHSLEDQGRASHSRAQDRVLSRKISRVEAEVMEEAEVGGLTWNGLQQSSLVGFARPQITGSVVAPRGTSRWVQGQTEAL